MSQAPDIVMEASDSRTRAPGTRIYVPEHSDMGRPGAKRPRQDRPESVAKLPLHEEKANNKGKASQPETKASSRKSACFECSLTHKACGSTICDHGKMKSECKHCIGLVHVRCQHLPQQAGGSAYELPDVGSACKTCATCKREKRKCMAGAHTGQKIHPNCLYLSNPSGKEVGAGRTNSSDMTTALVKHDGQSELKGAGQGKEESSGSEIDSDFTQEELRLALGNAIRKITRLETTVTRLTAENRKITRLETTVARLTAENRNLSRIFGDQPETGSSNLGSDVPSSDLEEGPCTAADGLDDLR